MKRPDFPSGLQACLLVLALFTAETVAGAALHDAQGVLGLTWSQSFALVTLLGNAGLFVFLMEFKGLGWRELFHPGRSLRRTLGLELPAALMLVPALVLLLSVAGTALARAIPPTDAETLFFERLFDGELATSLILVVLAPVLEEMLFRGIVLRGFLHRYGRIDAVAGSAVLFGFAHLNLYQFCAAVPLGVVLGWIFERTRSLWPCIAVHAAYNGALLAMSRFAATRVLLDPVASAGWWAGGTALAVAGVAWLSMLTRRPSAPGSEPAADS